MKTKNTPLLCTLTLAAFFSMLLVRVASAENTNAWTTTNGISANLLWSSPPNWSRGAVPVPTDDIIFNDGGATLNGSVLSVTGGGTNVFTPANITSIVDANRTVHWLYMCPTNTTGGWQNLYITNGVTLTVQGTEDNGMGPFGDFDNASGSATVSILNSLDTMYVGRKLGANITGLQANPTLVSISGEGTLFLNNTNNQMQVRDANSFGGAHTAILDMSALANFNANIGRLKVGMGEQNSTNLRAAGSLFLARTNLLVLSGPVYTNFFVQPATNTGLAELDNLVVGLNPQNNGNASTMSLGWSNGIYADAILIGGRKSGGATLQFNPAFANPTHLNTQPTPTAVFRNSKGGPVVYFRVGDEIDGSAGTAGAGTMDLTGGNIDIVADNMIVGRAQPNTGAETAIMRLGDGTLNANNIEFSSQGSALVRSAVTTTINLVGTKVTVTNSLKMVNGYLRTQPRTLTFGMGPDANGVSATLTTLGAVTTGFIDTSLTLNSTINDAITNSTFAMVNAQPFEASTLILDGGTISNASYILVTGYGASAAVNNAYGNAMTILNNGRILGSPILDLGVRTATPVNWDVSGVGGAIPGTFIISNLLEGIGTIEGNVLQAPGATIQAGEGTTAGTLTFAAGGLNSAVGNLTLNTNGNLAFGLSPNGASGNDSIAVQGTLTLLGTNNVTLTSIGGSFDTVNPYTLITTGGVLPAGAANFFKASGALGGSRYILTFDTTSSPNNVLLHVSGSGATSDTWVGGLNGNAWDVKTTANWSGGQFFDLDNVTFNDAGSASPAINAIGSLIPGSMTVATTNKNYGFAGTGSILVGGAFSAIGVGSVTFTNTGGVTFQDGLTIASNAVVLGNGQYSISGDPNTQVGLTLNGGSLTVAGDSAATFLNPVFAQILNVNSGHVNFVNSNANVFNGSSFNLNDANSSVVFGQPANVLATCDASFSGVGAIIQNGPGLIALSGANSGLSSQVVVNGGKLQILSPASAGGAGVVVNSGATFDVAGNSITVPVSAAGFGLGGQGAVISSSGTGGGITGGLTLTTNASVGGASSWSFDPVQNAGLFVMGGTLTASSITATTTNGFNLNKVGGNEVQYNFASVDPFLANIDVQGGMLYLENTGGLGNPTNTITVESGATVAFANFSDAINGTPTKKWILNGNGATATLLDFATTPTTIAGPVTLNGACILGVAPDSRIGSGGNNGIPGGAEILGTISGTGSLSKPGDDTWTLDGTNIYTGNTTVGGGTLKLQGGGSISSTPIISIQNGAIIDTTTRTADQNLNLASGQTLTTLNNGYINGNLVTAPGSTVAPGGGSTLDVLSVVGNVTLGGTTSMKLDPLLLTSDQLLATNGGNSIQYSGTLNLSNLEGSYAVGQVFTLFNASTYSGAFTTVTPTQPGSGLAWDTTRLAIDGTLKIIVGSVITGPTTNASITKVSLTSTNLIIHGTNNNVPNTSFHYVVLATPNLTNALGNWTPVVTNPFNADGTFDYTNPIVPGTPRQFIDIKAVP